jgi:N-acetylneuraminic acid mutarotase
MNSSFRAASALRYSAATTIMASERFGHFAIKMCSWRSRSATLPWKGRGFFLFGLAVLSGFFAPTLFVNAQVPVIDAPADLSRLTENEVFDLGTNQWTSKAPMPTARFAFGAAQAGGIIYAVGGELIDNCTFINTLEAYDPATDSWSNLSSMPTPRRSSSNFAAAVDGILYVVGGSTCCGCQTDAVETYDPTTNSWSTKAPISAPRRDVGLAVLFDNTLNRNILYAIGGGHDDNPGVTYFDTVEAYDPPTNMWTLKQHLNVARSPAVAVANGKIYAMGGVDGEGLVSIEEYDPIANTWTTKMATVPSSHSAFYAAATLNNKIYVIGGDDAAGYNSVASVDVYDPVADAFTPAPPMLTPRQQFPTAVLNNTVYAVGGFYYPVAIGQPFIYQIVASNHPSSYGASGLPSGLSVDPASGIIYGTISGSCPGSPYTVDSWFTATNTSGTGYAAVRFEINSCPPQGPTIISNNCATGRTGQPFSFEALAGDHVSSSAFFTAGGLPLELQIDPSSGLISGTAKVDGNYPVVLGVIDGSAETHAPLQLTFTSDPAVPIITSSDTATLVPGRFFTRTLTASDQNASFGYIGTNGELNGTLPSGLTFDALTHTISGTYTGGGTGDSAGQTDNSSAVSLIGRDGMIPPNRTIRPPLIGICQPFATNDGGTGGSVRTSNDTGTGGVTGTAPLNFFHAQTAQDALSRKVHGGAGTFDIPLPLTGNVGVECRSGGATNDYQMIVDFATSVTVESASVTSGTGMVSSFSGNGTPTITVNLTGVTNVQTITVTLHNVNNGTSTGDVPVSMGVLVGDVNGNAAVNASDVSLTKSQVGVAVNGSNFREDVNANGVINSVDVAQVKAEVGTALPP